MSRKPVKTRHRWITPEIRKAMAERASKTSQKEAARFFGCTPPTVRKAMRLHGFKPRRTGNYTREEVMAMQNLNYTRTHA